MLSAIIRKEFLQMARDGRFRLLAAVVLVLLLASLLTGARQWRGLRTERERAARVQREQWLNQGEKGPHSAAHFGVYVFKPAGTLGLLDRGVDAYSGSAVWLEAHKQNAFRYSPAQDGTSLLRFGELTAAFILQTVMPLLIVSLTFGAFAGERERGTLRFAVAQGARLDALLLGKALGVSAALSLLLVPSALCGSAALLLSGSGAASGGDLAARTALLTLCYLLYFGAWIAFALGVSALSRTARMALLSLLAAWVVATLVLPRLAADAAKRLFPTPSAFAFQAKIAKEMTGSPDGHGSSSARLEKLKEETMRRYRVKKLEDLPVGFEGIALQAGEDRSYPIFDRNFGAIDTQFGRQEDVTNAFGFAAPYLSVRSLSAALSGTDRATHADFQNASEKYRRVFIRTINDDITQHAHTGDSGYKNGRPLYERIPAFAYAPPAFGAVVRRSAIPLATIPTVFLAATLFAVVASRRQRILS